MPDFTRFEFVDEGDSLCFSELKHLSCFFVKERSNPYVKVPEFTLQVPKGEKGTKLETKIFNALRLTGLAPVYIPETNKINPLYSNLLLGSQPFIKEVFDAEDESRDI